MVVQKVVWKEKMKGFKYYRARLQAYSCMSPINITVIKYVVVFFTFFTVYIIFCQH